MWLEQAVYTSAKTRIGEGYHVVAKSTGVSSDMTKALNQLCPSHGALQSTHAQFESLNFHALTGDNLAVSRTVHGGKEFSSRGGLQVVTLTVILKRHQLAGFDNNPFRLARVARSMGQLRWLQQFPSQLPRVEVPDFDVAGQLAPLQPMMSQALAIYEAWRQGKTVLVVTPHEASEIVESLLLHLPIEERIACHFTTGLKWSKARPFRLYITQSLDVETRLLMKNARVNIIQLNQHDHFPVGTLAETQASPAASIPQADVLGSY